MTDDDRMDDMFNDIPLEYESNSEDLMLEKVKGFLELLRASEEPLHVLGRRQRRHPSLEASAPVAGLTGTKRAGTPFARFGTLAKACGDAFPRRGLVQS
jgi:hypothetical protein